MGIGNTLAGSYPLDAMVFYQPAQRRTCRDAHILLRSILVMDEDALKGNDVGKTHDLQP